MTTNITRQRVLAFIIDWFIVFFTGTMVGTILFLFNRDMKPDTIGIFLSVWYMAGVLLKDCFGQSIGKRTVNIEIVPADGRGKIPKYKLILRNLTSFIWPVELAVAALSDDHTRFSDQWLGLKVVGQPARLWR